MVKERGKERRKGNRRWRRNGEEPLIEGQKECGDESSEERRGIAVSYLGDTGIERVVEVGDERERGGGEEGNEGWGDGDPQSTGALTSRATLSDVKVWDGRHHYHRNSERALTYQQGYRSSLGSL